MTKEQKAKWIAALKSGRYEQGNGVLIDRNEYCCLGVAQELFRLRGMRGLPKNYVAGFLPYDIQTELATMNDDGLPFPLIAGFISENVEPTE